MRALDYRDYPTGNRYGKEEYNEKDEHFSRSRIHGVQPSDHNHLHIISQANNNSDVLKLTAQDDVYDSKHPPLFEIKSSAWKYDQ